MDNTSFYSAEDQLRLNQQRHEHRHEFFQLYDRSFPLQILGIAGVVGITISIIGLYSLIDEVVNDITEDMAFGLQPSQEIVIDEKV